MIDLRLFKDNMFRTMSLIGLCSAAGLLGMLYAFPLMYQNVLHMSALHTGLTTFLEAVGLMVASQLMPWTLQRLGLQRLLVYSLMGAITVFILITLFVASNPWLLRLFMFGVGFFLGQTVGAAQISAFKYIKPASMARATTLFQMENRLGSVLGVAILASILGTQNTPAGEPVQLLTYQYALFGAAIFLVVACLIAFRLKDSTDHGLRLKMDRAERAE
ncbi:MFS transporter [Virgibacillus halophilus]|uniref:MFS transporter n=2 Tax=Tigheibacillus halophilus TaxID=361280 RepID=A0ABU5C1P0_9BACI|nr:MFS transporter [Virgibacillus halophilus]